MHIIFPFNKLLKLVLGLSVILQFVVITYNHYSGYNELNNFGEFVIRFVAGVFYCMFAGFAIAYPDIFIIQYLNKRYHWRINVLKRAVIQFIITLVMAIFISSLLTIIVHLINRYSQDLSSVLFNNALIASVVNAFFMSILEAWTYLEESLSEKFKADKLHQVLLSETANRAAYEAQIRFEEEKNKYAQELIKQEKKLNKNLEEEILKREAVTQQLNYSREQLESILANIAGAAYRCNIEGENSFLYISEKIFDISGFHAFDFLGKSYLPYTSIIHPDDVEFYKTSILSAINKRTLFDFEYRIIHKNGEVVWVNENGKGIYNELNQYSFIDGIIVDISDRKRQEDNILQAKNELERVNNTLEHEIAERTKQLTETNTQLLKVQKENLQSQFEVLKQQVNPHFLFNSLNVLTSLIKVDPDLAESFTERLSKVYRYVLENKDRELVNLSTELEFLYAYLFLLEIRFMKKLIIDIRIDNSYYDSLILPLAIQLIIENAIKHNTFSKTHPLKIEIFIDEHKNLCIINNMNLRETKLISTGVGLENINRRYALVSDLTPEFVKTAEHFIARLPLLKNEKSD